MPKVSGWTPAAPRRSTPETGAARFELSGALKTKMTEASDVTALPGGRFLVVGDKKDAAYIIDSEGSRKKLELPGLKNGKSQLEGVAYDPVKKNLFVVREEAGEVLRYEWDAMKKNDEPVLEKRIELKNKGPSNKGVEGAAYLPADLSPTGDAQLLLTKEGKPRELLMMSDNGKGKPLPVKLEREVLAVCRDFSGAAVDPRTGNIFISSDESSTVAQVKLHRDGDKIIGKLVQSFPLRDEKGKSLDRVEGLTFNPKGDLFVLTENDGVLRQLSRK
ncbi:MAG: SdiA-regulated domain-containing protein [Archangium sp.]|nr:SdiA-regulated domain-containing protein [Archangium sp.]